MKSEWSWKERFDALGGIIIIPTYNNAQTLESVVFETQKYCNHVLVVNDGSTDQTYEIISRIPDIQIISYTKNKGKGRALQLGLSYAKEKGFRYAITIDSDGQHFPTDIPRFIESIEKKSDRLLVGARNIEQENMPKQNTFANKFSNFWFRLETGINLTDTQSGFRLYPVQQMSVSGFGFTTKYEYELEILVYAAWGGVNIENIPIQVFYAPKEERVSHFRPIRDFTRISILNSILVVITFLWILPRDFFRKLTWTNIKSFFDKHLMKTQDSNSKIVKSVMLGVFFGIIPVWGYQMILAVITAQCLHLNKVITLIASNISIPPFIPFILYFSYLFGGWTLRKPITLSFEEINFETVQSVVGQYIIGSFVFALFASLVIGVGLAGLLAIKRKRV